MPISDFHVNHSARFCFYSKYGFVKRWWQLFAPKLTDRQRKTYNCRQRQNKTHLDYIVKCILQYKAHIMIGHFD